MKKFLLASVAFGALAMPALGADMAPAPIYKAPVPMALPTWTGFYVGVNGGYGWSNGNVTETPFQNFGAPVFAVPAATANSRLEGALFGVHGGYNWQAGAFVLGIEGDFDGAGLNNSAAGVGPDPLGGAGGTATVGVMAHQDVQWLATVRGRLGYTWGSSMVYATGGGAWENLRTNVLLSTDTAAALFSESATASFTNTRSGYAAGAGYEWMINPNWIARVEYLHYGFGSGGNAFALPVSCGTGGPGATCGGTFAGNNRSIDAVRAALSFKFW
ncbi:MAG: porin family protein [Xanthobacteraceae bacterium]|nr:porin family protein [Xanthobacteraceae bacterium]